MHPLIEQLAQRPDTITVLQTVPSGFQKVLGVAEIAAVLLAYLMLGAVIFIAIRVQKSIAAARDSFDRASKELREVASDAKHMSKTLGAIADSVQENLAGVSETVEYANRRARRSVAALADRVDDFSDTVGVVQGDAQNALLSAVAALKGVGAGLAALKRRTRGVRGRKNATPAPPPAEPRGKGGKTGPRLRKRPVATR